MANSKLADKLLAPSEKRKYNRSHFAKAAGNYDKATKFLSFGRDSKWKELLIESLPSVNAPRVLDLACGTGDITFAVKERYPDGSVTGIDITPEMIQIAEKRAAANKLECIFIEGDISKLQLNESSFDIITAGYAFRNTPELDHTIASVASLLSQGGTLSILEFAKSGIPLVQKAQIITMKLWGATCGTLFDKNPSLHSYIGSSLELFPDQPTFIKKLEDAHLELVFRKRVMCGSLEILTLRKK